jgi:phospholipid/cholesterol/gamma-HCH transport system substrate-binding protein
MDRSPTRDFIVGLFVLAGIAAIAYLSLSIGGFNWRNPDHLQLSAAFDETGGLAADSPVVIAGVRVGKISSITLQDDFRAHVTMLLDPALKLSTDTSASIVTAGVLGDRYVELQPGGDDKMLKSGDQITFTESAVLLERLIGQLVYGSTKGKPSAKDAGSSPAATSPLKSP